MVLTVLQVAEKPSIAETLARVLSKNDFIRRSSVASGCAVYEYSGIFQGKPARFVTTSVMGHVFEIDFPSSYNNWDKVDPADLFDAPILRREANSKTRIRAHLAKKAQYCDHVILWLDCDREGENICFEVIECIRDTLKKRNSSRDLQLSGPYQQIWRARFSSLAEPDLVLASSQLVSPNRDEALAVDCRQELDLKIGCAFTRFQTSFFHGKYSDCDSKLISYGPCQTPTLYLCVQRANHIAAFQSEQFYKIDVTLSLGGQSSYQLEWGRGRVFDLNATKLLKSMIEEVNLAVVNDIKTTQQRISRPEALNTVALLKLASSQLGMSPNYAMQVAERLYLKGIITYPRTETSQYPNAFDYRKAVALFAKHPVWDSYATGLLNGRLTPPRKGKDAGDHPPITPVYAATTEDTGAGDPWRLYTLITHRFLATLSPDCQYLNTRVSFQVGEEFFSYTGRTLLDKGFTELIPATETSYQSAPSCNVGDTFTLSSVTISTHQTSPPDYLSESDLIGLMEDHGIGTDASMAVHIQNIVERHYVAVQTAGRKLVPTPLGLCLIQGYMEIDPELARPFVRASIESQCSLIAKGIAEKEEVLRHTLALFKEKFLYLRNNVPLMDAFFEVHFTPISKKAQPFSRCGVCKRYMKLVVSRSTRVICEHCTTTYELPSQGRIKLYNGLTCPLDNFELLLHTHKNGKTVPLCPMCFNDPPFPDSTQRMHCFECAHPTCCYGLNAHRVCSCPQETCDGALCLDPVSAPKWKLYCQKCSYHLNVQDGVHRIHLLHQKPFCETCGSTLVHFVMHKKHPLCATTPELKGCLVCDPELHQLVEGTTIRIRPVTRRRGRRKVVDPKMLFSAF